MCRYDRFPAAAAEYVGLGLAIFCSMSRVEDGRLASLAWVAFGVAWGALAMSEMCRRPPFMPPRFPPTTALLARISFPVLNPLRSVRGSKSLILGRPDALLPSRRSEVGLDNKPAGQSVVSSCFISLPLFFSKGMAGKLCGPDLRIECVHFQSYF